MASQTEKKAPESAERWYYAPRNPNLRLPEDLGAMLGDPVRPDGRQQMYTSPVSVWRGYSFSPASDSLLGAGGLLHFAGGVFFLPAGAPPPDLQPKGELARLGSTLRAALTGFSAGHVPSMLLGEAGEIIGHLMIESLVRKEEEKARLQELSFALPWVNVVEAAYREVPASAGPCLLVNAENQKGEKQGYALNLSSEMWPGIFFRERMVREILYFVTEAQSQLMDYDTHAKIQLAKMGLEITESAVNADSIALAMERWEAQRSHKIISFKRLTVSQVNEALVETWITGLKATRARLGNEGWRQEASLALKYLEPMLPHYRRVPAMAHQLEVFEQVAAGQKDPNWTPNWNPGDYRFNFVPGEYPRK